MSNYDAYAPNEVITAASFDNLRKTVLNIYDVGFGDRGYGQGQDINASLATIHPYPNWPHMPPVKNAGDMITSYEWQQLQSAMSVCLLHQDSDMVKLPSIHSYDQDNIVAAEVSYGKFSTGDIPYCLKEMDSNRLIAGPMSMTLFGPIYSNMRTDPWNDEIKLSVRVEFKTGDDARYFFNSGGQLRFSFNRTGDTNMAQDAFWTAFLSQIGMISFGAYSTSTLNKTSSCFKSFNIGYYNLSPNPQKVFTINGDCIKLLPWPQINRHIGDSVTEYDITASSKMNSLTEQKQSLQLDMTPGTAQIDGTSCNKFCPTKCSKPLPPKKAIPIKQNKNPIKLHRPSPYEKYDPPKLVIPPDTCDPKTDIWGKCEKAYANSVARIEFEYGIAKAEYDATYAAGYALAQWELDHTWGLTPESIDDPFPEPKKEPIKDSFENNKPKGYRSFDKLEGWTDGEEIEFEKPLIKKDSVSYLKPDEYVSFDIKTTAKPKVIAPKINVKHSFEMTFSNKKDFRKDINSIFSLGNLRVEFDTAIDLEYAKNTIIEYEFVDERNTLSIDTVVLEKINIERPAIKKEFHDMTDRITNDYTEYTDFIFADSREYFVRNYHKIPNPNSFVIMDTVVGKLNDEKLKAMYGDAQVMPNHTKEIDPTEDDYKDLYQEQCCEGSRTIVGSNVLNTNDGIIKAMVTIPSCSDDKGELPISVDFVKETKDTMLIKPHFILPVFIPKGISLSLLSTICDFVTDFIKILKRNSYDDCRISILTWSHDFKLIYDGKISNPDLEYKINSLMPSSETITNANAVYKYIVNEAKTDLKTQKYVFWVCAGSASPPVSPTSPNISNYIWNLYNRLNQTEWAAVGKIVKIDKNSDLLARSQELSVLNKIDGGDLKTVEYWVDGDYLTEIKSLQQPVQQIVIYGLNRCVQQTLYVKVTTTTDMVIDIHIPINSAQEASVTSHAKKWNQAVNLTRFIDNLGEIYYAYELNPRRLKQANMKIDKLHSLSQQIIKGQNG